ncbi:acetate kinase, partial [Enterobacter mori]
ILAINAGSSSLKFQLIEMPEEKIVTKGLIERIGLKDSIFTIDVNGEKNTEINDIANHEDAVNIMLESFKNHGIIESIYDI